MVAGEAHAAQQSEILTQAQVIREIAFNQRSGGLAGGVGLRGKRAVVDAYAEQVVFCLEEVYMPPEKLLGPASASTSAWPPT